MAIEEALRHCELFSELDDTELELIAPFCRARTYQAGERIVSADDEAVDLYFLHEGRVSLMIQLRSGVERSGDVTLEDIEPGHVFGWSSVVKQQRFTASAVALEPVTVYALGASDLNALFDEHPHLGFVVMKQLANVISSRLRHTRNELERRASSED